MNDNFALNKSKLFAVRIVNLSRYLQDEKKEFVLSKQLLKSGTSIGANIREAQFAESKKDFLHKMSIALREAYESEYWLELLGETGYLSVQEFNSMFEDCQELRKLLSSITKTTKTSIGN